MSAAQVTAERKPSDHDAPAASAPPSQFGSTGGYRPSSIDAARTPPPLSPDQIAQRIAQIEQTVNTIYEAGVIDVPNTKKRDGMGGTISAAEGQTLRRLVAQHKPKRTIEIGMGSGLSGVHICWGLLEAGGGFHTAIDPWQDKDWDCCALAVRDAAGCADMFDWIQERSDQALPLMVRGGQEVDFIFIDGSHRFEHAFLDFYYSDQLLPVGGIVVFDDADWPTVRRAVNFAVRHRDFEFVAGSQVELGPLTRPWGWKMRANRRKRFKQFGWPAREANHPKPYEAIALRKTTPANDKDWHFWASLEG